MREKKMPKRKKRKKIEHGAFSKLASFTSSAIKEYKKNFLVGIHIRKKGLLPSGEKFITVAKKVQKHKPIGIMASCVSFEDLNEVIKDAKNLKSHLDLKSMLLNIFRQDGNLTQIILRFNLEKGKISLLKSFLKFVKN